MRFSISMVGPAHCRRFEIVPLAMPNSDNRRTLLAIWTVEE